MSLVSNRSNLLVPQCPPNILWNPLVFLDSWLWSLVRHHHFVTLTFSFVTLRTSQWHVHRNLRTFLLGTKSRRWRRCGGHQGNISWSTSRSSASRTMRESSSYMLLLIRSQSAQKTKDYHYYQLSFTIVFYVFLDSPEYFCSSKHTKFCNTPPQLIAS